MPPLSIDDLLTNARTHTIRKGVTLHTQRFSTEDGPGLRTTIFFKGCPLNCEWCHNPESISSKRQLHWLENRCIHCSTCVKVCPQKALRWEGDALLIDRSLCDLCAECSEECPSNALEILGRYTIPEELIREAAKDQAYYTASGGGVTLSGGEPTMQPAYAVRLLETLNQAGIPTALDTCGQFSTQTLDLLLPFTDLVLFDIKFMDAEEHQRHTGQTNEEILKNLLAIRDRMRTQQQPRHLWVRTPLIPGATATEANIRAIGNFLTAELSDVVERWELLAFNNLCRDKYRRLGMEWKYAQTPLLTRAEMNAFEAIARSAFHPERTFVTGAARVEG
jgi:pyruvate formate lyase activating enzyme